MINVKEFTANVERLIDHAIADYREWQLCGGREVDEVTESMYEDFQNGWSAKLGQKYLKIMRENSVWAFIVVDENDKKFKVGDVLKPAGWATPARNKARANIADESFAGSITWTGPAYL